MTTAEKTPQGVPEQATKSTRDFPCHGSGSIAIADERFPPFRPQQSPLNQKPEPPSAPKPTPPAQKWPCHGSGGIYSE